jgi:hypothetical protein
MYFDLNILLYISTGLLLVFLAWIIYLHIKIRKILVGKNAKMLDDSIDFLNKEIIELREFEKDSMAYYEDVEKRLKRSVQTVETLRFNPFKGVGEGGNQSFSISALDENGDGLILSSLHSRDRISIFAKPVEKFASKFETTEEEKVVLEKSKKKLKS